MSPTPNNVVIIGGGLGGAKAAEALREKGFTGSITLISNEADAPYERPPLSKGYLAGRSPFEDALVHPLQWYAGHDVDLRLSTTATAVDKVGRTVTLSDGTELPYDKLLLATGAVPRTLSVAGADADNVLYLRRHHDADAIRATFGDGHRLVIIGAGWIGLEVAAAARDADTGVAVVEMAELPLLGVVGPDIARVFADLHTSRGVQLHLGATMEEITLDDDGRANGVRLADGTLIPAEAVVVGVGVSPDIALAEAAGLAIDNGVLVDASLCTSDPDIYAVGDIANQAHPSLGVRVRVEHWVTALKQPAVAVAALLGSRGTDGIYGELPHRHPAPPTDQHRRPRHPLSTTQHTAAARHPALGRRLATPVHHHHRPTGHGLTPPTAARPDRTPISRNAGQTGRQPCPRQNTPSSKIN